MTLVEAQPRGGVPCLAAMRWWSNRGPQAERKRKLEAGLFLQCLQSFGRRVLHIFDRGFATEPWLHLCVILHQRFVVRWPHGQYLIDEQGRTRKAWEIARGKRAWGKRLIWMVNWVKIGTQILA